MSDSLKSLKMIIPIIGIVIILSIFVFFLCRTVYELRRDTEYSNIWHAEAEKLGFSFDEFDNNLVNDLLKIKIISNSYLSNYATYNVLRGFREGCKVILFDISFHPTLYDDSLITLILLYTPKLGFPNLRLLEKRDRDDSFWKYFEPDMSSRKIDFHKEDPDFADSFLIYGEDKQRIRDIFSAAVRRQIIPFRGKRLSLSVLDQNMVIHFHRRLDPTDAEHIILSAMQLWHILSSGIGLHDSHT